MGSFDFLFRIFLKVYYFRTKFFFLFFGNIRRNDDEEIISLRRIWNPWNYRGVIMVKVNLYLESR